MKKSTMFAILGVGGALAYFYFKNQEGTQSKALSGLNVRINPDRLMSGAMAYMGVNPILQEPIKNIANKTVLKLMGY